MNREGKDIWLIGDVLTSLSGNELPSTRAVLQKYFFNHKVLRKSSANGVIDVAKELTVIWKEFKGPEVAIIQNQDIVKKIKNVINKYEKLKKSKHRRTTIQINHEKLFTELLDKAFNIAPIANYHGTKPGPKPKVYVSPEQNEDVDINSDSETEFHCGKDSSETDDMDFEATLSGYQKMKLSIDQKEPNFVDKAMKSADVFSTLDRIQLSSPKFTLLCASMARAAEIDLNESVISSSTVARRRVGHRDAITTVVKDQFLSTVTSRLVVHWDGKKLKDATNDDKNVRNKLVERISVVLAGVDTEKIITVAKAENGTGLVAAEVVYEHLLEWNITGLVVATCTDTTAANTGHTNGAVVLFEKLMEKNLLYFACRHHILELVIAAIFVLLFGDTTAPSRSMFENFKRDWSMIDQTKFDPLSMDLFKKNTYISKLRSSVIDYVEKVLLENNKKTILRGDYKEMLQLCLIVLGKDIPNYTFNVPKCCSNARWMAHIVYSLKIFLFRQQLELSETELRNLQEICLFACLIYAKAWIQCCSPSNAPYNDLELMKELHRYGKVNKDISECAIGKLEDHLWYLGSELVVLSLFSDKVNNAEKRRIFQKMKKLNDGKWVQRNKKLEGPKDINKKSLSDFVDSSSLTVLKSLQIDIGFMFENNVREWNNLEEYKAAKKIVDSFKVVNDSAERALKLMTEVNCSLTNNEEQKQKVLQVIEDNRKRIPTTQKYVLSSYKLLK